MLRIDLEQMLSRLRNQIYECRNALEKARDKRSTLEEMAERIRTTMDRVEQNIADNQQIIGRQLDQLDPRLKFLGEYRQHVLGTLNSPSVRAAVETGKNDLQRTRAEFDKTDRAITEMEGTVGSLEAERARLEQKSLLDDETLAGAAVSLREDLLALARAGMEKLL